MNIKLSAFLLGVILLFSTGCAGDNTNSISETESSQNSISEASDISQNSNSKTDISQNSISKPESEPSEKNSASDISQNSNSKTESFPSSNSVENSGSENSNSKSEGSRAENSNSQNSNSKPESKPESSQNSNSEQSSKPESSQNSNSKTESSQNSNPKPESSVPAPEPSKPESKTESSAPAPEPSKPAEPSKLPVAAVSVTLSRHELTMTVGDTVQLSAEISPYDTDDQQLTWYWSDTSVIQIDSSVNVTAVGAGKATITVKTNNGKSDECIVTVKAKEQPKPVESSTKPVEQSKPSEVSKPAEQSSTTPAPSQPTTEPSQTSKEQSTQIDPKYAAYYYPYDDAAIIADLRSVGEAKKMIWEDSLWVRSKGTEWGSRLDEEWGYRIVNGKYQGTCSFMFPVSNDESVDGERFRN